MNLIDIANETYAYYENRKAPETIHYTSEELNKLKEKEVNFKGIDLVLTKDTVNETLINLRKEKNAGRIAVLNFASAIHPGGGWLTGARAQEEAIARSSNLYFGLIQCPEFYEKGAKHKAGDCTYTNDILYSKKVELTKDDYGEIIDPIYFDVITCAAPNMRATKTISKDSEEYRDLILERSHNIFRIANEYKIDTLVLGAWGCGVFGNDPLEIAIALLSTAFNSEATKIIFAVPYSKENYEGFEKGMNAMKLFMDYCESEIIEKDTNN